MQKAASVWTFFYGSYMNFDVLKEVDIVPQQWEIAYVAGYELVIAPRANLVPSDRHIAYGILAPIAHDELARLYSEHAQGILGETYLPTPVIATTGDGQFRPAFSYIAPQMTPKPVDRAYVERIAKPARSFGFPQWYIKHIESFAPEN